MGSVDIDIVKAEVKTLLAEAGIHCKRLEEAIASLEKHYVFPLSKEGFAILQDESDHLARADQMAYRFSKAQDCIGAKLFEAAMLWMQEDTNKPFRDILNRLEKLGILKTDEWAFVRDIRNQIAHDYTFSPETERALVNQIYQHRNILIRILDTIDSKIK